MKEVLGIMLTGDEEAPSQKYESEEEVLDYHLNDTNGPSLVGGSETEVSDTIYNEPVLD